MQMLESSASKWAEKARAVALKGELLISGIHQGAAAGQSLDVVNPATGAVLSTVARGSAEDVDLAVASARQAYRSGAWSKAAPRERARVLMRLADLIEAHADDFAVMDVLNMGKPIAEMLSIDIPGAVLTFRFVAEALDKVEGSVTATSHDSLHYVLHQPYGVVGCIVPWNYPLMMAAWKVAPALGAGNCVVLKPAEQSPHSAGLLGRLFLAAGGPPGVFNVVSGLGEEAGKALALHHDVDRIAFTGSTGVGRLMLQYAGQSNLKSVAIECGGKSPNVVFADVEDLGAAARSAAASIFANQGEICTAGSRIIVHESIHKPFVDLMIAEARKFVPGDPLDPLTTLGSLVSREHKETVLGYIESAHKDRATLVHSEEVADELRHGAFVGPTIFTGVTSDMRIAREEIFGPVAAVMSFSHYEDAVRLSNQTEFGLGAGVWTSRLDTAHRFARDVEAGMVWVNGYMHGDMTQPWIGWNQSGNGRDKGLLSLVENTRPKSVWVTLGNR
jgi:acyl-CoA reductase-like NAD-dependent aldehyde dehydrogenase